MGEIAGSARMRLIGVPFAVHAMGLLVSLLVAINVATMTRESA